MPPRATDTEEPTMYDETLIEPAVPQTPAERLRARRAAGLVGDLED